MLKSKFLLLILISLTVFSFAFIGSNIEGQVSQINDNILAQSDGDTGTGEGHGEYVERGGERHESTTERNERATTRERSNESSN